MRVIFMGTPEFAVPALVALVEAGHEVVAAYTQPPRPAGRGKQLQPSPVQREAEARGIAVHYPASLKGAEEQADFAALDADIAVVAAYGLILPQPILDAPKHGCLNIHGSLLPRWRGAAPIQRAILAGDEETGVCIMRMERGLDTGAVLKTGKTPIRSPIKTEFLRHILPRKNAAMLTAELAKMGAELMVAVLADLPGHPEIPQSEDGVTYAHKIDKVEAKLDFAEGSVMVERRVRAFNPAPGAYFEHKGERIKVLEAEVLLEPADNPSFSTEPGMVIDPGRLIGFGDRMHLVIGCGDGAVVAKLVQRAGRPAMASDDMLRGFAILPGTKLA